ncbi:MAG TPA: hypothetical protein VHH36_04635 [Candidatus Thermoplasmatota archaeon]|nr:hypothetical protein [Candidatus Thermoplasmatota archaeon]
MMIDEFQERRKPLSMSEEKEIKVRIPLDYHIKLHTVKVALENYFADLAEEAPVARSK